MENCLHSVTMKIFLLISHVDKSCIIRRHVYLLYDCLLSYSLKLFFLSFSASLSLFMLKEGACEMKMHITNSNQSDGRYFLGKDIFQILFSQV